MRTLLAASPALIALTGCPSFTTMGTARTIPDGATQVFVSGGTQSAPSFIDDEYVSLPIVEVGVRHGLTDELEVNGKIWPFGAEVSAKIQLARSASERSGVDVALAPGGSIYPLGEDSGTIGWLHLPLLVGVNTPGGSQLVVAPRLSNLFLSEDGQTSSIFWAGGSIGIAARAGEAFWIMPEVSIMRAVAISSGPRVTTDFAFDGVILFAGVGLVFGGRVHGRIAPPPGLPTPGPPPAAAGDVVPGAAAPAPAVAAPPFAPPAPGPIPSSPVPPPSPAPERARGFALGARAGYGLAAGDIRAGSSLRRTIDGRIPMRLDVTYALSSGLSLGAYLARDEGRMDPGVDSACEAIGAPCSATNWHLGLQGEYALGRGPTLAPWVGAAIGIERLSIEEGGFPRSDFEGFELAVQGGARHRLSRALWIGPYLQLSYGRYDSLNGRSLAGQTGHGWLDLGLRAELR